MDGLGEALYRSILGPAAEAYRGNPNPDGQLRFRADGFVCPHCYQLAHQEWWNAEEFRFTKNAAGHQAGAVGAPLLDIWFAHCQGCKKRSIWVDDQVVYPQVSLAPVAHADLPAEVRGDYEEARRVFQVSPKLAAAALRLALQRLTIVLGEKGKNLNDDIGQLVKKGLPTFVQQAFDAVRHLGNEAVHPGTINLNDTPDTARTLFQVINIIVEKMISEPKKIAAMYDLLPQSALDAIAKRDK